MLQCKFKREKSFKGKISELTPRYVTIHSADEKKKPLKPSHKAV
ncbi:MAG: hypothetical protein OH343_04710 [Candidatus Parvarchaeota archaeon]|nr:hypothetical protein [Candidatus Parvarchaeum tengchongense]